eukprot:Ihof_evm1s134 gene=Ihof_evmTU1s134
MDSYAYTPGEYDLHGNVMNYPPSPVVDGEEEAEKMQTTRLQSPFTWNLSERCINSDVSPLMKQDDNEMQKNIEDGDGKEKNKILESNSIIDKTSLTPDTDFNLTNNLQHVNEAIGSSFDFTNQNLTESKELVSMADGEWDLLFGNMDTMTLTLDPLLPILPDIDNPTGFNLLNNGLSTPTQSTVLASTHNHLDNNILSQLQNVPLSPLLSPVDTHTSVQSGKNKRSTEDNDQDNALTKRKKHTREEKFEGIPRMNCPHCNITLRPTYINLDEVLLLCKKCEYPLGSGDDPLPLLFQYPVTI